MSSEVQSNKQQNHNNGESQPNMIQILRIETLHPPADPHILQLARMLQDNIVALEDAVLADLGKQRQECTVTETGPVVKACLWAAENLEEWTKPEKPRVEAFRSSWDATVYPVPKGVGLVISSVPLFHDPLRAMQWLNRFPAQAVELPYHPDVPAAGGCDRRGVPRGDEAVRVHADDFCAHREARAKVPRP